MGWSGVSLLKTSVQSVEWVVYQNWSAEWSPYPPLGRRPTEEGKRRLSEMDFGGASRKEVWRCEVGSRDVRVHC
jgi:hypothetical protein